MSRFEDSHSWHSIFFFVYNPINLKNITINPKVNCPDKSMLNRTTTTLSKLTRRLTLVDSHTQIHKLVVRVVSHGPNVPVPVGHSHTPTVCTTHTDWPAC